MDLAVRDGREASEVSEEKNNGRKFRTALRTVETLEGFSFDWSNVP
jgi:hypothetical protein